MNLFVGSSATVRLADNPVKIRQETRYPWEGRVKIAVDPAQPATFDVAVRIPGWVDTEVMPGGLYQFMNASGSRSRVSSASTAKTRSCRSSAASHGFNAAGSQAMSSS